MAVATRNTEQTGATGKRMIMRMEGGKKGKDEEKLECKMAGEEGKLRKH